MVALNESDVSRRFLTISEAASVARVCGRTIRAWIQRGQLPASKLGSVVRIDRAELEKVLAGRAASN